MDVIQKIAHELAVSPNQVSAAVTLIDEGATVPFIARYRKEVTGGLDDIQLRLLDERLIYLRELNSRRETILESIEAQGKLSPELEKSIQEADTKTRLEDLYLPYKPKRRTKAQIAREAGLEPLADTILDDRNCIPEQVASAFINADKAIADVTAALDGARQIIMERISEDAELVTTLRERIWQKGIMRSAVGKAKETEAAKFKDYFDFQEAINKIPSHRALALFRGRNENLLTLTLLPGNNEKEDHQLCAQIVAKHIQVSDTSKAADAWLAETARFAWKVKLFTRIDLDLKQQLREAAELEAIRVFANNLKDLLLAAPAGPKATLGLDPGIRTGVKVAVVDATGKLLATDTIYPHAPRNQWDASIATVAKLIVQHQVELVSIGNGTGSRETDQLVADLMKQHKDLKFSKITVSEAGASVYSASELASKEFPNIDVSLRGAVSIARRLQDPLAELVKIEPKSIGVGQYQHDVNQIQLARGLDAVVEDCVNAVGVDINTASAALLKQVSGISNTISQNIVSFRDEQGAFTNRKQLKKVPRLGAKAYEQAAGFLRIMNGDNPLDSSSVHPESYPVIEDIVQKTGTPITDLIGKQSFLRSLNATDYTNQDFGLPTVTDILQELEKPGRDPRPEFKSVTFKAGIEKITDLKEGMTLEGVVTNVANFGAFVDIGVHQDGLVHISHLADVFVKDPRDVVKTGEMVKVKVLEIDVARKRIALSMKKEAPVESKSSKSEKQQTRKANKPRQVSAPTQAQGSMANAFAKALKK
ncbi:RNA-binding transcriptional accessory protein [Methylococcaceae bacterium CS1]|nr:RNA-binding transcriptional accessory protein [Methyloprofundus sp.]TXK99074.1 RNA-binding transcriptional accessory protein [Methylococcaceae bacterium CS4]TXL01027.1 RNA-binding transcriptional accessory protein [Methylococcaceae bacterium CS5]TXL08563.1 RNA-binding transcriptional accessory protein [Methylococcaceae bacterium CS3]TXL09176.1 RNA-binding transcriptional accessory protein [Methylococcaceae bacterium CS1]TXL11360.1 RNA-binding transcriptional accessory protein [Methylococcac